MISYEQWNADVENTIKEIEAYDMLQKGYETLACLPENDGTYFAKAGYYKNLKEDCRSFLHELRKYGAEQFGVD